MKTKLKKEIKDISTALERAAPADAVLLGLVTFKDGHEMRVYAKRGALDCLALTADIMTDGAENVEKCQITKAGLHDCQMCIMWQLLNAGSFDELIKNDNLFMKE